MNPASIFWPVVALIGRTFVVLLMIPYRRFLAFAVSNVVVLVVWGRFALAISAA